MAASEPKRFSATKGIISEDFCHERGHPRASKEDLQSGHAGLAKQELANELPILGWAEDARYLQPWPD